MAFKTKLDASNNRQINMRERSELILPGVTRFGLPQGELSVGPDLTTTRTLVPSVDNVTSTFTGNTATGVYTWSFGYADMAEAEHLIQNFTLESESGEVQNIGPVWVGRDPVEVNGETLYLRYEGILFDLTLAEVTDMGDGTITGSTRSTYEKLEADALDYNGDFIWVDVRGITKTENLMITQIGIGQTTTDIGIDELGNVVVMGSDERLKENIEPIQGALDKVLGLRGVTYTWKDKKAGGEGVRIGFIAQEVQEVVPELVHNVGSTDYLGVNYNNAVPLIIEAIKELVNKTVYTSEPAADTITTIKELNVEEIYSEDNNISLNFNGSHETAKNGGISVIKGVSEEEDSIFQINEHGDWEFLPNLSIKKYTPISSEDTTGNPGNLTYDEDFLYLKTQGGWGRINLEKF